MEKRELEKGDVVQINPSSERWGGMLLVVSEPKSWGCQGYLLSHNDFEAVRVKRTMKAYARIKFEDIEYVGKVFWDIEDNKEIKD